MRRTVDSGLGDEQTREIRHVLGKECLAHVVGLAGAGKSAMLSVAADAWRRQGVEAHGAALAGKAADSLQDASGIPSRTLASLEKSWKTGHAPIKAGDVLVIDEAGMVGTRQMARVAEKMSEIGAKLVLIGDPDQLQPIEADMPLRDLVAKHGAARLTEVRRQRQDWQRDATRDLARGETSQAVEAYQRAGAVKEHGRQDEAIEALAEQYAMDALASDTRHSRLALAHKRADVHALNQSIRAALRDPATQEADVLLQTEAGKRAFGPDDRLVFTRNDPELGVKNGMLGTARKAARGKIVVELDGEDRQKVTFNPHDYQTFDHGCAVTIHKPQGVTVDNAYVLGSRSMDKHLTNVALTRHRDAVQLFTSLEDRPAWTQNREHQLKRPPHARWPLARVSQINSRTSTCGHCKRATALAKYPERGDYAISDTRMGGEVPAHVESSSAGLLDHLGLRPIIPIAALRERQVSRDPLGLGGLPGAIGAGIEDTALSFGGLVRIACRRRFARIFRHHLVQDVLVADEIEEDGVRAPDLRHVCAEHRAKSVDQGARDAEALDHHKGQKAQDLVIAQLIQPFHRPQDVRPRRISLVRCSEIEATVSKRRNCW